MPSKKKKGARRPKTVPGTNREHRMVDAEELRENVKKRKVVTR